MKDKRKNINDDYQGSDDLEIFDLDEFDFEEEIVADTFETIQREEAYADEPEYYEEEVYEDEPEYYEEEVYEDEPEYYEEEVYEDDDDIEYEDLDAPQVKDLRRSEKVGQKPVPQKKRGSNPFVKMVAFIQTFLEEASPMDYIVSSIGVLVLIVAIVTVSMFGSKGSITEHVETMAGVGEQLGGIHIVGESALLAVTDAYVAALNSTPTEEEENTEGVEVTVNFTSVKEDLKVKFLDKTTGELIKGVGFKVELTDSKKNKTSLVDDNKDGIIYETGMKAGSYQVLCLSVGGFKFPETASEVKIKATIDYNKIDIVDEIKKESDINAAIEDTAPKQEAPAENVLKDTVEFVNSTKTPIGDGGAYQQVDKGTITDPSTVASMTGRFLAMAAGGSISGVDTIEAGKSADFIAQPTGFDGDVTYEWSISGGTPTSSTAQNINITADSSGSILITLTMKGTVDGTADVETTVNKTVTITEAPKNPAVKNVSVSSDSDSMKPGESLIFRATVEGDNLTDTGVSWTASAGSIDSSGKLTIGSDVKAGTSITVTAKANADASKTGSKTITVSALPATVTGVTASNMSIAVGEKKTLQGEVQGTNLTDKAITWSIAEADKAYLTLAGAEVSALPAGAGKTVTVTAKANADQSKTATCTVTIGNTSLSLDQSKVTLTKGSTVTLKATAANVSNPAVTWASADTKIATVANGVVTAVAAGTTKITATYNGLNAVCEVTVSGGAITLNKHKTTIAKGKKETLTVTVANTTNPVLTWKSSAEAVAKVDAKGVVTAVAKGVANIIVTYEGVTAVCEVTVTTGAETDATTKLKDKNGKQIYVKENDKYREAVYADFYTATAFYLQAGGQFRYTGWQTIDNKTYFYDKNGNVVTGEQVIQGVKYNFASDGALSMGNGTLGIDISKWNGKINWQAVKNSGVSYAIIRVGYRGSATGVLVEDPTFKTNIQGATAAGIKVGIYFFSQAVNEVEAVEEASMTINLIKNYKITYPVFIDVEDSGGRADGIDVNTRTAVCKAFCETMKNSGYTGGIYANKSWFTNKLNTPALNNYKIWLAQYSDKPTYGGRYDLWQYTSKGAIGGISGHVDLNQSYLGY